MALRTLIAFILVCFFTACSGGGGGGGKNPAPPPGGGLVADAGENRTVDVGEHVRLIGQPTAGANALLTWTWDQIGGPSVPFTTDRYILNFDAPQVTTSVVLTFRLTVSNVTGGRASDTVAIFVRAPPINTPPEAHAGDDQIVNPGATVVIVGTAIDTDGSIVDIAWYQQSGPPVTAFGEGTRLTFTAPDTGSREVLTFEMVARDDDGGTGSDTVSITVDGPDNIPPQAYAGEDITVNPSERVGLQGSASDSDGYVANYEWVQTSGPAVTLELANSAHPVFNAPDTSSTVMLTLQMIVTDDDGATASDSITITVTQHEPVSDIQVPDADFARCLAEKGLNVAADVTYLNCIGYGIQSLDGIAQFTGLNYLHMSDNRLTTVDLTHNIQLVRVNLANNQLTSVQLPAIGTLTMLDLSGNQFTSLDVSHLGGLEDLHVESNQLSSLDLRQNSHLWQIVAANNLFTAADLSQNPDLDFISFDDNHLQSIVLPKSGKLSQLLVRHNALISLDLSGQSGMWWMYLDDNQLTSLDLSDCTALRILSADGNRLTALDVSKNSGLEELSLVGNQLSSIDLSANTSLSRLDLSSNLLSSISANAGVPLTRVDVTTNAALDCADIEGLKDQHPHTVVIHNVPDCGWVQDVFKDAANFVARCAAPRTGVDPYSNAPYPDVQGTRIDENNWLRSWSNDLYLWYDEIIDANPENFSTPDYFKQLKTTALTPSGTPKDQFHFTWDTADYRELSQSGTTAGYGASFVLIASRPPRLALVAYTEPGSPAATAPANLSRGAEIVAVDGVNVVDGTDIATLNNGMFPATVGETHQFEVRDLGATTTRSFAMTSATITTFPVQFAEYIDTPSGRVGYMLFNDHIGPAEADLIDIFGWFSQNQVVDLVLDLRYNGGGYIAIASEVAYMIAGASRTSGQTFGLTEFNDKHATIDPFTGDPIEPIPFVDVSLGFSVPYGNPLPSLNLSRVFMLTGPDTCSASEEIINALRGVDVEVIQIGSTTCGKPYGFYPEDNCGTTYFSIQFRSINAKGFGDYADGFTPENSPGGIGVLVPGCAVADDFTHDFGDPEEGRLSAALDFRDNLGCPALGGFSPRALSGRDLSAIDGHVVKPEWLRNAILTTPGT